MTPKAENIIAELNRIFAEFKRPLVIVEAGTIRRTEPEYEQGDGHSTRYIAEWVRDVNTFKIKHSFFSIDMEIKTAQAYLIINCLSPFVSLLEGDSITHLKDLIGYYNIDFCYLDSANDAQNTLDEFLIAWPKITQGGSIMVDDCNLNSVELLKGDLLIPYLTNNQINFVSLPTNQILIRK